MRVAVLALLAIGACAPGGPPASIDASPDATRIDAAGNPDAFACVHVHLDAGGWGEDCTGSGLCHEGLGWCVNGSCRPQCVQPLACLACEGTEQHTSESGQCYCAP